MPSARRSPKTARSSSRAASAPRATWCARRTPRVLAVTGPHATAEVMEAVRAPPQAARSLRTSFRRRASSSRKHYAYLKISEGCNRCTFCIIPSMRGDLVSRPVGDVMKEAESLVKAGVKELLVVSQDMSAYGVDVKYRTGFWGGSR